GSVNPASGAYTAPAGVVAQDASTLGNTPPALPNGDTPAPTPVTLSPQKIDVVKSAAPPKQTGPSRYDIGFSINVSNSGTLPATNVNVLDNLANTFASGAPALTIAVPPAVTAQGGATLAQCALAPAAFNGTSNIALLKGDQTLQPGQSCVITFTVTVAYPSVASVPAVQQLNTAIASTATSANNGGSYTGTNFNPPSGMLARDDSTDSPTLPGTANGDSPAPTPISFSPQTLDVVKSTGTLVQVGPTTFEVPYNVIVKNTGTVTDTNVQVIDNLSAAFNAGSPVIAIKAGSFVANAPASAVACAGPASAYDGVNNIALLKGDFNLAAGEQCSIKFTAVITYPSAAAVPTAAQNNIAYATANISANAGGTVNPATGVFTPPSGEITQDASTSANIPPASPNGDAPSPTPVTLTPQKIDVVKSASTPVQAGPTIFDIPYTVKVKNTGTVAATNVNVVDNLSLTFANGTPVITVPVAPVIIANGGATAAQCAASAGAFNGTGNLAMLKGDQTLQPGQECDISFTVHLAYPSVASIPTNLQNNSVIATTASSPNSGGSFTGASFNSPSGNLATDISTNTSTLPTAANGDTSSPTPISLSPQIVDVVNQALPYVQTGPSSFEVPYSVIIKNTGTVT
ncbi:MAG: hypothetical protein WCB36_01705, partial [Burkholderiales bacterium]